MQFQPQQVASLITLQTTWKSTGHGANVNPLLTSIDSIDSMRKRDLADHFSGGRKPHEAWPWISRLRRRPTPVDDVSYSDHRQHQQGQQGPQGPQGPQVPDHDVLPHQHDRRSVKMCQVPTQRR